MSFANPCTYIFVFLWFVADQMDLIIILDSSQKSTKEFKEMKEFAKSVIDAQQVGVDKTRIGIIHFDYFAHTKSTLLPNTSPADLKQVLDDMPMGSHNAYYHTALWLLAEDLLTTHRGARKGVPWVSLFITDSPDVNATRWLTFRTIDMMKETNINMLAVSIGLGRWDVELLAQITGSPDLVIEVAETEKLKYHVEDVADLIQEQGKKVDIFDGHLLLTLIKHSSSD